MTKIAKLLVGTMLSLMFSFILVGYASLTDNVSIRGEGKLTIPEGLFITNVTVLGSPSNMDAQSFEFFEYSTTLKVSGNRKSSWQNRAGSVTYEITVLNNTDLEYAYRDIYYQSSADGYDNSYISKTTGNKKIAVTCSLNNLNSSQRVVAPRGTLTFNVTYTYGKDLSDVTYDTLINYQFGINVETEEEAREAVYSKFANILNTSSTYEELLTKIDDKYDGYNEWTSNYIGNVGSATTDDAVTVNTLFAGQLQMLINGQQRAARVIIKHENLDNNNMTGDDYIAVNEQNKGSPFYGYGCEMTMYFTVDALDRANGEAEVFVAVYTCDRDAAGNIVGEWYRIGDTYVGKAPIVSYDGTAGGTGSFVTDNWVANRADYPLSENFTYRVNQGTTIKTLMQEYDAAATAELQNLLDRAKAMIDDTTYAGTGIMIVEKAYNSAVDFFTVDADGKPHVIEGITRAQLCHVISDLDHALVEAQKVIDEILGRT